MWMKIVSFIKLLSHLFTGLFVKNYVFTVFLSGASESAKADIESLLKNLSFKINIVNDKALANVIINSSGTQMGVVVDMQSGVANAYVPLRNGKNDKIVDTSIAIIANALSFFGRFL